MTKLIRGWHVYLDKYPVPDTSGGHATPVVPPERIALGDRPTPRVFGPYTIPFGSRKFALRLSDGKLLKNTATPSATADEGHDPVVTPRITLDSAQTGDKPLLPVAGTIPGRSTQHRILDDYKRHVEDLQASRPSGASRAAAPAASATAAGDAKVTRLNRGSDEIPDLSGHVEVSSSSEERESSSTHPPSSGSEATDGLRAALKKRSSQKARPGHSATSKGKQLAQNYSRSDRAARKLPGMRGKFGQSSQQGSSAPGLRSRRMPVIDSSESSDAPVEKIPVRLRKSGTVKAKGLPDLKTTNLDEYTDFLEGYVSEKPTAEEIHAAENNSEKVFGKSWAEVSLADIEKKIGEFRDRYKKLVQTVSDSDESALNAGKNAIHQARLLAAPTIGTAIRVKIADSDIRRNCFAHLYHLDTRLALE